MPKHIFFFDRLLDNPHASMAVERNAEKHSWPVENMLGHFKDFPFYDVYNLKHLHIFPNEDKKYLICFMQMPVLSAPYLSSEAIKELQNNDNLFLVLISVHEYIITPKELAKNLLKRSIPLNKVVVLCSNIEAHDQVLEGVRYIAINFWESYSRVHIKTLPGSTIVSAQERLDTLNSASKKYISLNRNVKPHRIWWYYSILKSEMLDQGHVSFHLPSVNQAEYAMVCAKHWVLKNIPENLHDDFAKAAVRKMFTRRLDPLSKNMVINYVSSIKNFYTDSVISLVTESEATKNFITEKTYKAIANMHPFFIIGNPDQHAFLRARGYHTFEDLLGINQVTNYNEAMVLLDKLKNKSLDYLKQEVRENYFDKLVHNQQLFLNRTNSWTTIENAVFTALGTDKV